jgi:hypothetical protein
MELIECSFSDYGAIFDRLYHSFNLAAFNKLNEHRCDGVRYLIFKDTRVRLGLIGGIRNNMFMTPFSAPFGGFSFLKDDLDIRHIEEAIRLLEKYIVGQGLSGVRFILPPLFYHDTNLAKMMNVLHRQKYQTINADLDFYIDVSDMVRYKDNIWNNARKNLKIGLQSSIDFKVCDQPDEIKAVYDVIETNRRVKSKPMTMKYEEIISTAQVIKTDFFLCIHNKVNIAAAIVYHVADGIVYVPYWGDIDGYGAIKPMNFLSFNIFDHYRKAGKKIVHIGIATEDSMPNYGLCEFKESIGCRIIPKFTYFKDFNT